MRYVIIGAGAVGGTIGGFLAAANKDVVLVARGAHLEALRTTGLRLATPSGVRTQHIPAIGGPDELQPREDDVLVLAVKSQQTVAALDQWSARPLPVLCVQNGVNNEREALRRFEHVYGVSVLLPAGHEEPGLVTAVSEPTPGVLPIGRYPRGIDKTATAVADDLTDAGFVSRPDENVMRWKYGKLRLNLMNALEALTGADARGEAGQRIRVRAVDEANAVYRAAGIDVVSAEEEDEPRRRHITWGDVPGAPRGGGSSWQSLTRGTGDIEAGFLNGEIVLLGRLHDVPTPVNALLQRLADRAAAVGQRPGELTASDVERRLD